MTSASAVAACRIITGSALVAGGVASAVDVARLRAKARSDGASSRPLARMDHTLEALAAVGSGALLVTGAAVLAPRAALAAAGRGLAHVGPAAGRAERSTNLVADMRASRPAAAVVGVGLGVPFAGVPAVVRPEVDPGPAGPGG